MLTQNLNELDTILQSSNALPQFEKRFDTVLMNLYQYKDSEQFQKGMEQLREKHKSISSPDTMQGFGYSKPYGYAGDFNIIDKIYTYHTSDNKEYKVWDEYFHKSAAARAVRNRKNYFIDLMQNNKSSKAQINILDLASGPCRDIKEFFDADTAHDNFYFDCVDLDTQAIAYAKELLADKVSNVNFINKNIFRFAPETKYDVIWSAGLFDYFDDKTFERILQRLLETNPKAKIVIGNFDAAKCCVPYMEVIGEWYLNYRSPEQMRQIAINAGARPSTISIESEAEGVNLFLNINP